MIDIIRVCPDQYATCTVSPYHRTQIKFLPIFHDHAPYMTRVHLMDFYGLQWNNVGVGWGHVCISKINIFYWYKPPYYTYYDYGVKSNRLLYHRIPHKLKNAHVAYCTCLVTLKDAKAKRNNWNQNWDLSKLQIFTFLCSNHIRKFLYGGLLVPLSCIIVVPL